MHCKERNAATKKNNFTTKLARNIQKTNKSLLTKQIMHEPMYEESLCVCVCIKQVLCLSLLFHM